MFFDDIDLPGIKPGKPTFDKRFGKRIKYALNPVDYYTDSEIACLPPGEKFVFDIETYPNYFLIAFKNVDTGKCLAFEDSPDSQINLHNLLWFVKQHWLVGFNSNTFDVPLLFACLHGYGRQDLKRMANFIIDNDAYPQTTYEEWNIPLFAMPKLSHVDLIEVCPLQGSLKLYGGRLHCKRMQSLPFEHYESLTAEQAPIVRNYCFNDLDVTILLLVNLKQQLALRADLTAQYGIDLMSKSDAQIAEAVIGSEYKKLTKRRAEKVKEGEGPLKYGYTCRYEVPDFLQFQTPEMQEVLFRIRNAEFGLDGNGSPRMPDELKTDKGDDEKDAGYKFQFRGTWYKVAMGGLHSCEKSIGYDTEKGEYIIEDNDVESYYPRIKINQRLFPSHLGPAYIDIYESIVDRRVGAKRAAKAAKEKKDKAQEIYWKAQADALKIVINGAFGKLGSKYSIIYSPDLMLQVTLSGQLCLLMLIERLELAGIHVISANTDGIVSRYHKSLQPTMRAVIKQWEKDTQFVTEETRYLGLYSRDINNYFAVKCKQVDGVWTNQHDGCKGKGAYANPWDDPALAIFRFHKNPETTVCVNAVAEFLTEGKPVAETVHACGQIEKFISIKNASSGAHKAGEYLGSPVRWYYARGIHDAIYTSNGNTVGKTQGAKPLMDLPLALPEDLDYDWYINEAEEILHKIGYYKQPESLALF